MNKIISILVVVMMLLSSRVYAGLGEGNPTFIVVVDGDYGDKIKKPLWNECNSALSKRGFMVVRPNRPIYDLDRLDNIHINYDYILYVNIIEFTETRQDSNNRFPRIGDFNIHVDNTIYHEKLKIQIEVLSSHRSLIYPNNTNLQSVFESSREDKTSRTDISNNDFSTSSCSDSRQRSFLFEDIARKVSDTLANNRQIFIKIAKDQENIQLNGLNSSQSSYHKPITTKKSYANVTNKKETDIYQFIIGKDPKPIVGRKYYGYIIENNRYILKSIYSPIQIISSDSRRIKALVEFEYINPKYGKYGQDDLTTDHPLK